MLVALVLSAATPLLAELPPVPVPVENPITEPKRVLGKILFWDEQLSSDGTIACGTCHRPAAGGADPRSARHPGIDKGTIDDVHGSPGIVARNRSGEVVTHAVFGAEPQVTPRLTPSNFTGLWAEELFWDGRAGSRFVDPVSGKAVIARGGALENLALAALVNNAEMARADRAWRDLTADIERARPLALATRWPPDTGAAIARLGTYPALFAAA